MNDVQVTDVCYWHEDRSEWLCRECGRPRLHYGVTICCLSGSRDQSLDQYREWVNTPDWYASKLPAKTADSEPFPDLVTWAKQHI